MFTFSFSIRFQRKFEWKYNRKKILILVLFLIKKFYDLREEYKIHLNTLYKKLVLIIILFY